MSKRVGTLIREAGQVARPCPAKKAPGRKPKLSKEYLAKKRAIRTTSNRPLVELSLNEVNQMFVGLAEKVVEGIMSIQSGDNPRIVEKKLNVLY